MVTASLELAELLEKYDHVQERVRRITELEHQGDAITHQIMEQLHRTFVTPLDREDIALLAHSLDDIMDFIEGAANAMLLYRVAQPTNWARELAAIIVKMTQGLDKAMPRLRHKAQMKQLLEHCVEMNRLENEADEVFRRAITELFANTPDPVEIIKWREIYELLESATDRGEDVANVLEGVVLKYG